MESLSALQLLSRRPRIDEPETWTSDRAGRSGRPLALLQVAVGEKELDRRPTAACCDGESDPAVQSSWTRSGFAGYRFPAEVIVLAVRGYLRSACRIATGKAFGSPG